jgi:hypothetical protein
MGSNRREARRRPRSSCSLQHVRRGRCAGPEQSRPRRSMGHDPGVVSCAIAASLPRSGSRSVSTRSEQSRRYAWLRPLELMWGARTIALAEGNWKDRPLSGRRRVQPWYEDYTNRRSYAERFGMSVDQFRAYRQTGTYGAYRVAFRKWPEMTIGCVVRESDARLAEGAAPGRVADPDHAQDSAVRSETLRVGYAARFPRRIGHIRWRHAKSRTIRRAARTRRMP